jgi:hypothetical protein
MTLMPLSKGKCLLWDATCSDTLAKSYIASTFRSAGAAAMSAEKRKHKKYEGLVNLYKFVSFAVETLGPFGDKALDLVKNLGKRLIESTGLESSGSELSFNRATQLIFSLPFLLLINYKKFTIYKLSHNQIIVSHK